MSIQEIEAAIAALPKDEQQELFTRLSERLTHDDAASAFRRLSARLSAQARANGLTEEKLDALLSEDE